MASFTGGSVWLVSEQRGGNGCLLAETEQSLVYRIEAN